VRDFSSTTEPPLSTCLSAIDSNHLFHAPISSGVGFSNP
jgi:hypothetical protein